MMDKLKDIRQENAARNEELRMALKSVYPVRDKLQESLVDNYSDELLDKITEMNKMIENAENVLDMSASDAIDYYAERYPEYVDDNKNVNEVGIKRMERLKKRWNN